MFCGWKIRYTVSSNFVLFAQVCFGVHMNFRIVFPLCEEITLGLYITLGKVDLWVLLIFFQPMSMGCLFGFRVLLNSFH